MGQFSVEKPGLPGSVLSGNQQSLVTIGALTTNLGVRSSNLFGRASYSNELLPFLRLKL